VCIPGFLAGIGTGRVGDGDCIRSESAGDNDTFVPISVSGDDSEGLALEVPALPTLTWLVVALMDASNAYAEDAEVTLAPAPALPGASGSGSERD
jgi:hypothetical protein